jgi:hypothetical protein
VASARLPAAADSRDTTRRQCRSLRSDFRGRSRLPCCSRVVVEPTGTIRVMSPLPAVPVRGRRAGRAERARGRAAEWTPAARAWWEAAEARSRPVAPAPRLWAASAVEQTDVAGVFLRSVGWRRSSELLELTAASREKKALAEPARRATGVAARRAAREVVLEKGARPATLGPKTDPPARQRGSSKPPSRIKHPTWARARSLRT